MGGVPLQGRGKGGGADGGGDGVDVFEALVALRTAAHRTDHSAVAMKRSTSAFRKRSVPVLPGSLCAGVSRPEAAQRLTVRGDTFASEATSAAVRSAVSVTWQILDTRPLGVKHPFSAEVDSRRRMA
jgi:hypothetical protein